MPAARHAAVFEVLILMGERSQKVGRVFQGLAEFVLMLVILVPVAVCLPATASNEFDHRTILADSRLVRQDRALEAVGIEPLQRVEVPLGDEEIRIFVPGSGSFFRLWQRAGLVDGELVFFWASDQRDDPPGETFEDLMAYSFAGRCEGFRQTDGGTRCRGVFDGEPDWLSIYQLASEKGLWDLPDQPVNRSVMSTGAWSMLVELRRGDEYRAYSYRALDQREKDLDDRRAVAIVDLFRSLFDELARPYSELHYRGIVPSQLSNLFRPCGSDDLKVMAHWLFEHSFFRTFPLPLPSEYALRA